METSSNKKRVFESSSLFNYKLYKIVIKKVIKSFIQPAPGLYCSIETELLWDRALSEIVIPIAKIDFFRKIKNFEFQNDISPTTIDSA